MNCPMVNGLHEGCCAGEKVVGWMMRVAEEREKWVCTRISLGYLGIYFGGRAHGTC